MSTREVESSSVLRGEEEAARFGEVATEIEMEEEQRGEEEGQQ